MMAHGAQIEWTPTEVKKDGKGGGGRTRHERQCRQDADHGGDDRRARCGVCRRAGLRAARDRRRSARHRIATPADAIQVLLAAGANPNVKAPDGATPLHQAVQARQVPIIRSLVAAGAKLDAINKDNLTPLQVAEKPEPPPPPGNNSDSRAYRPKRDTREDVIAALRELMGLGPNDPTPVPPPAPPDAEDDTKDASTDESESASATPPAAAPAPAVTAQGAR